MADVVVRITAVDAASPIFVKIGGAATKAAGDMEKAGAKGKKGMEDIASGARRADTELRTFERTSLAVGAAMGALALGTSMAGAAYQNQQRQLTAITRLYGEAAEGALQYAERIQDTTRFSNDAARDSLVLLNTLTQNYGLQQSQIEMLLSRSADLAAMHGKSLTEVSQMVSNALRGEGEYIEQIGVSMNQMFVAAQAAARGMDDFIYGMTAAEQAAFRYTLLMEQTATAQGYAMESAEGTRGAIALITNEFQDATQAMGGFLGPVGEVAAQFSSYALWLPLIASQIGRVSSLLVNSARQFQTFNNATATMGAFAGPIGVGIAAVTAGLGILTVKWAEEKQRQAQVAAQAEQTAQSYEMLQKSIDQMYLNGNRSAADFARSQANYQQQWIEGWNRSIADAANSLDDEGFFEGLLNDTTSAFADILELVDDFPGGLNSIQGMLGEDFDYSWLRRQAKVGKTEFIEALTVDADEVAQINSAYQQLFSLASNPNVDFTGMESQWTAFRDRTFQKFLEGGIDNNMIGEEFQRWVSIQTEILSRGAADVEAALDDYNQAFERNELRLDGWSDAALKQLDVFDRLVTQVNDVRNAAMQGSSAGGGIFNYMEGNPLGPLGDISYLQLTTEQIALAGASIANLQEVMNTGDWNNTAINERLETINDLFLSGKIGGERYADMLVWLSMNYDQFGTHSAEMIDNMRRFGDASKDVERDITDLGTALAAGGNAAADYAAKLESAREKFAASGRDAIRQRITDMRELQAAQEEFISGYMESAGFDTPLAQVNLTSLRSDASALAGDFALAASQLDNMYRAIVGNTEAIKSQADTILQWATELINVRGELGRIDELIGKDLIDQTQYDAAQNAYDSIAESTLRITDNLDAVQAIQAPIIAQSLEWQAQMTETLLGQDAATQRVTLGWMDATSAAQAFQLVQQLTLMQSGELGAVSEQTMNTIVQGAVMANPLLFDMLTSMGVISGTPVDFQINTEALAGAQSELEALTTSITQLVDTLREIYNLPPLEVKVEGEEKISDVMAQINEWGGIDGKQIEIEVSPKLAMGRDFTGMYQADPIEVPATPVFTDDGTGGASWDNAPIEIPVIPVIKGSGGSGNPLSPTGMGDTAVEFPVIPVFQEPAAMMEPMEYPITPVVDAPPEIPEPEPVTVKLTADSSQVSAAVQVWAGASINGPMFHFQQDSSQVSAAALVWGASVITGPTFNFFPNAAGVEIRAGMVAGTTYEGPTFNFVADDSAVQAAIGRYADGAVIATQYVNIVARTSGAVGGNFKLHGGSLHYANGGMVPFWAAENNNPEIAHFRNGGSALLDREGMYFAPPMTMISPSNTVRDNSLGGDTFVFHINVEGSVHREQEFKATLMSEIRGAFKKRNTAIGV